VAAALNRNGQRVSVVAQGGGTNKPNRVYGGKGSSATSGDNYANSMLYTGTDTYDAYAPNVAVVSGGTAADNQPGADVPIAGLRTSSTWPAASPGFSSAEWDFGSVSYKWPLLRGVGGQ
jgi:hypothetical protein